MKKITLCFLVSCMGINLSAQSTAKQQNLVLSHRTCGTTEHHNFLMETRPNYRKDLEKYNLRLTDYISQQSQNKISTYSLPINIPVVFHVVYNTNAENISDNQVISQLDVLNADFQKLNADTSLIPNLFRPVAAGLPFNFCLAQRDPNGNPTNGIVHVYTPNTSFGTDDKVKKTAQGGDDAWDVSRYMNIWICDLGNSLLGYGEFPTASYSNTYGLVINYTCTGTLGTAQAPFNKGRTGTHEFGHCFNLEHIWGDDFGSCFGSDNCADTPNQKGENYGTPTFPQGTAAGGGCCNASDTSSMFMNYMDYTDDAGMFMFTQDQCNRMAAVLNNPPYNSLQTSDGCNAVVLLSDDASGISVIQPSGNTCDSLITPVVVIKNWGLNALTSAQINYSLDNSPTQLFSFSGNLPSLDTAHVSLPSLTVSPGTHTFSAYTTLPNGLTDQNTANDTASANFTVIANGNALPFFEGFEGTNFVPAGWTLFNPDGGDTWTRTTAAAKGGIASARIDNYNNDFTGERDEIITPALNLSTINSPVLTFDLAYKLYTNPTANPNYSDTLEILISTDCGTTWNSIYKKFGTQLTTATPTFQNSAFTPNANQWRFEVVPLSSFAFAQRALIKFRNISQYENFLYIDNINILAFTGLESQPIKEQISFYPNPTNGKLHIDAAALQNTEYSLEIINTAGKILHEQKITHESLVDAEHLSDGYYILRISGKNFIFTQPLIIIK
jgi:hypothetical protein